MERYVDIHTHHPAAGSTTPLSAGIHPWDAERFPATIPGLEDAEAIGEIGLDALRGPAREVQLAALRVQLRLACERGLPVVLHCVKAFEPLMHELKACMPRAVIFHGFIGSPQQAQQALAQGCYLSFGARTFASPRTLDALRSTPLDRLFVETDEAPDPIGELYARVAAARGVTVDTLRRATFENYERIFGKRNG